MIPQLKLLKSTMTKDEEVQTLTNANTSIVFALASLYLPWMKIPILSWVIKFYIAKWLRPLVNEGVVVVYFKAVDWEQLAKAHDFTQTIQNLSVLLSTGASDDEIKKASQDYDAALRNAISLKPSN